MKVDRRKFSLILARLYSPHDGERLAALSIATNILKEQGLTWETALLGGEVNSKGYVKVGSPVSQDQPVFYKKHVNMTILEQMEFCLKRYKDLSMSDRMLLTTLRPQVERNQLALSPRNQRLLHDLVHKIKESEGKS